MKVEFIEEPELEFGAGGRHIDPRFGIAHYGPADAGRSTAPAAVKVGMVGDPASLDGIRQWLERCGDGIPAKETHLRNLFPAFPGFHEDQGFRAELVLDDQMVREIPERSLRQLTGMDPDPAVRDAVELFVAEIEQLADESRCDVIVCARPPHLPEDPPEDEQQAGSDDTGTAEVPLLAAREFRHLLKARAMGARVPLQVIRARTWDPALARRQASRPELANPPQDEATRAWNLHAALYYKAGGAPWRLARDPRDLATCFVGVSFFRTLDATALHTSVAQVFNERGDGVVVRGEEATVSKEDRQPHLTADDARALLLDALARYRAVHKTAPARVVLHKTSSFSDAEVAGLDAAAHEDKLDSCELIWVRRREHARLFRRGEHPPLRGTLLTLDDHSVVLYTRGSVPFYATYPGMYVPAPIGLQLRSVERSPRQLAAETLALTKLNWNQTAMDGKEPVTIHTADRVGDILKYVGPDDPVAARYAFYM